MLTSKLLLLIAQVQFIYCYQEGGQGKRYLRKWVGPSVFAGLTILAMLGHFSWLSALGALLYIGAANGFAYGENYTHNEERLKVLYRGLCGASYGLSSALIYLGHGRWGMALINFVLSIFGSIALGVYSPIPNSWGNWKTRIEDTIIALCYVV